MKDLQIEKKKKRILLKNQKGTYIYWTINRKKLNKTQRSSRELSEAQWNSRKVKAVKGAQGANQGSWSNPSNQGVDKVKCSRKQSSN